MESQTPHLDLINDPAQLRSLSIAELQVLANEIRHKIITTVSQTGGHLAPSLGVVELTLAILSEFDLLQDKLIWDVGHQAYAHKLLTGRNHNFHTLRSLGGISGFPRMEESKYDHFGVGHSSTSISAGLGMALARDLQNKSHHVISVIGDGSLTAGEAFEGLNLAGHMGKRLIVILNDNEMSISPNVGALSLFLSRALSSRWLRQTRREALKFLRGIPRIGQKLALYALRGEWSFKSFFTPGMLFEAFRFTYIGPIDGHNIAALKENLQRASIVEDGPVLLHVRTHKGKGYAPAENHPDQYHGVGNFIPSTGEPVKNSDIPTFTRIFSDALIDLAKEDEKVIAITAAMAEGTGTDKFKRIFPDRFIDTGICEQHAVTFSAGLASQGFKPVLAIYSTFLQRGYDQVVHDVCLQNLPVVFCIDRAGLVGADGATHHGAFDIAYLRHVPNIVLMAPRDEDMLKHCLKTALSLNAPCAIRYPRGKAFGVKISEHMRILQRGEGEFLLEGKDLAIIAAGSCVRPALKAANKIQNELNLSVTVFDPIWLKPLPKAQLKIIAQRYKKILIIEEGSLAGGFGSAILEFWADSDLLNGLTIKRLGLPDKFIEHGSQEQLRSLVNIDCNGIFETAKIYLHKDQ